MATNEKRYCSICDVEVRETTGQTGGKFGSGELPPPYVHVRPVNCPLQQLREEQTYTVGDSDLNPPQQ